MTVVFCIPARHPCDAVAAYQTECRARTVQRRSVYNAVEHSWEGLHSITQTDFSRKKLCKKLRYREEHSASVVLSWCTL